MKRSVLPILGLFIAGCSTTTTPPPPTPAPVQAQTPVVATPALPPAKPSPVAKVESPFEVFEKMRNAIDEKSVYFAYDRYAVSSSDAPTVEQHAKLAIEFPHDHITVQGNCDERGGREYNLALGQRRADAVKERLAMLGVEKSRVDTVSFGKEKPREPCHEEKCWSKNRRADLVDTWK